MGFLINNKNQSVVTREVSGVNVGSILEFPKGTTLPASFLEANGGTFDQNVWPDLYKFLGSNKLPNGYTSDARVGDVKWFQNRNAIPYGWTAADGNNVIPFTDFPDVKAAMDAGRLVTVTEAIYTSDSSKRASWTNATTGFRTPDYNGKSAGSLGSLFLRGDGGVAAPVGTIQGDAIRNLVGDISLHASERPNIIGGTSGVFYPRTTHVGKYRSPVDLPELVVPGVNSYGIAAIDASRSVPTASENRPLNTSGCWAVCLVDPNIKAIKAAGFVDNDGLLSAVGVLKQVDAISTQVQRIEEKTLVPVLELLWSGSAGTVPFTFQLSSPISVGDFIQVEHADSNSSPSAPLIITPGMLASGAVFGVSFGQTGFTSFTMIDPTSFAARSYTSGFGVKKIYRLRYEYK